jgi:hypothetical protein
MADKGGRVTMDELLVLFKGAGYPPGLAAPSAFSSGIATLALLKDSWRSHSIPVLLAPRQVQF